MLGAKVDESPTIIDEDTMLGANEQFTSFILGEAGCTQVGKAVFRAICLEGGVLGTEAI